MRCISPSGTATGAATPEKRLTASAYKMIRADAGLNAPAYCGAFPEIY